MQLSIFDSFGGPIVKATPRVKPVQKSEHAKKQLPSPEEAIINLTYTYQDKNNIKESGNYALFTPSITVEGSKEHPSPLCESIAMSAVPLPRPSYRPKLPRKTIESGILSEAQLEDIIMAGEAHSHMIHENTTRLGYMIGSGTGYGKGNTIAGIILDSFNNDQQKAVWISKNDNAHFNSIEYWTAIGGKSQDCIDHSKIKKDQTINFRRGILITKYGLLKSGFEYVKNENGNDLLKGRIKQLIDWLGYDYTGVIVFDESHMMANALDQKGDRGIKKSSMVAQVGIILQRLLPKARIVYSSATGATEINNLVYAERLGLYGPGTPFPNSKVFIDEIKKSGVTAMELVARDLKAMGLYSSKSLSYEGVEYDTIIHETTKPQKKLYDDLARAWQYVLSNINDAIEVNGTGKNARSAAYSAFWSAHQRFFNLIILTIQFPSVAEDIHKELENGNAIIIQLTNTNEAQTVRALTKAKDKAKPGESLEQLDISPKSVLIEFLRSSFPTIQFESYIDENGNTQSRPVTDSEGNLIHNQESIRIREKIIDKINEELIIPTSPLDSFINTFGTHNVAEVTGRSLRIVQEPDPETGELRLIEQRRSHSHIKSEIKDFNDDKRRILIFSEAGGTGGSFHADKRIKNQRKRIHYVFQPGWRADVAVQGFGRSHRSFQAQCPTFKLCSTDITAQKRFLSSIARRLEQLGALTKGQRDTGGQGILDNSYNFESSYAKDALALLYRDILHTGSPITIKELETMMGLKLLKEVEGTQELNVELLYDIKKFLNRILSLEIHYMSKVFNAFESKLQGLIKQAKTQGTYDDGISNVKAKSIKVVEEQTIHVHDRTQAETKLLTLQLIVDQELTSFYSIKLQRAFDQHKFIGFYKHNTSGQVYAFFDSHSVLSNEGHRTDYVERISVIANSVHQKEEIYSDYQPLTETDAESLWEDQMKQTPPTRTVYHSIIKGLLLPIWNMIPGETKVNRYIDDSGNVHLGRYIPKLQLPTLRNRFSLNENLSISELITALNKGHRIKLTNGFILRKTTIQGIPSIEVTEIPRNMYSEIPKWNMITRIQNSLLDIKSAHIPSKLAPEVLSKLMSTLKVQVNSVI